MMRIAKNIKKLRTSKGFTQDDLAKKINVTRQAISSWENGRTQPDAQMLEKLSEVFEISLEELIYGEKRNTTIETEVKNYRSTATVIIAILGSLLVAAGLGLIFTFGWQKLPFLMKAVFAFVPLLLGQGAAVYTLKKKSNSVSFREGASVLWGAGIVSTLALANSIFDVNLGFNNCLFLDTVMVLPIMYFMNSVSPLFFCFFGVINWGIFFGYYRYISFIEITSVLILIFIIAFPLFKKEKLSKAALNIAKWFSTLSLLLSAYFISDLFGGVFVLAGLGVSILLFVYKKDFSFFSPSGFVGSVGSFAISIMAAIFLEEDLDINPKNDFKFYLLIVIGIALSLAVLVYAIVKFKENIEDNMVRLFSAIGFSAIFFIFLLNVSMVPLKLQFDTESSLLTIIIIFLEGLLFILYGAKENKLFPINLGFLAIIALFVHYMLGYKPDLLVNGIILLLMGAVLLGVNLSVTKKKQKESEVTPK